MPAITTQKESLIRLPEVIRRTGCSKPWLYKLIDAGKFPKQVKIGSAVDMMKRNAAGKYQHIALIPLADIPARADAGEWDSNVLLGMRLIGTYLDHVQGNKEKNLLSFRWMVAVLYIRETTVKNGMPYYRNHGVMLPLIPYCEPEDES